MKVGIILLSQDNMYVDNHGRLPKRPDFDKELLVALVNGQEYVCGRGTEKSLPKSITENAKFCNADDYDINLGIITLHTNPPHMLIVTRSQEYIHTGKHFSLEGYNRYFDCSTLEIWIKK